MLTSRSLRVWGRVLRLIIQYPICWMGQRSRRGHCVQAKVEVTGRKVPGSPPKRKRTCRGSRKGSSRLRARRRRSARLVTSPQEGALHDVKETRSEPREGRRILPHCQGRERRLLRRRLWLERRFGFVERHVEVDEVPGSGVRFRPLPEEKRRFRTSMRILAGDLARRNMPMPPGLGLDGWFRKFLELKHGTWHGVSTRLWDGKYGPFPEDPTWNDQLDDLSRRAEAMRRSVRERLARGERVMIPHGRRDLPAALARRPRRRRGQ
jgi:hypothetical protein